MPNISMMFQSKYCNKGFSGAKFAPQNIILTCTLFRAENKAQRFRKIKCDLSLIA